MNLDSLNEDIADSALRLIDQIEKDYVACMNKSFPKTQIKRTYLLQLKQDISSLKNAVHLWKKEFNSRSIFNIKISDAISKKVHLMRLDDCNAAVLKAQSCIRMDYYDLYKIRFGFFRNKTKRPTKKEVMVFEKHKEVKKKK